MEIRKSRMQPPRWTKTKLERGLAPPRLQEFDEGPNVVGQKHKSASQANITIQALERRVPNHLLMVALLEHLCSLYESDSEKSKKLFKVLCQQLSRLKVMPAFVCLEEFGAVRNKYKEAINDLFQVAASSINAVEEGPSSLHHKNKKMNRLPKKIFNWRPSLSHVQDLLQLNCSRYKEEFLELGRIGKGGFGSVFRVKNQLDGREYAVKKVPLRETDPELCLKVLREVKVLASLNHINVVGYHSAWLEYVPPEDGGMPKLPRVSTQPGRLCDMGDSNSSGAFNRNTEFSHSNSIIFEDLSDQNHTEMEEASQGICFTAGADQQAMNSTESSATSVFTDKNSEGVSPCEKRKKLSPFSAHKGFHKSASSSNLGVSQGDNQMHNNIDQGESSSRGSNSCNSKRLGIKLFIQMQLCKTTLKEWMQDRNSELYKTGHLPDIVTNMDIFRQICEGVKYIHSQKLMHRDLKPRNIFLQGVSSSFNGSVRDKITIKIGDFGLARNDMFVLDPREGGEMVSMIEPPVISLTPLGKMGSSDSDSLINWPTMGVGTCTYASPEQLHNKRYDMKSDIYSLGIIFFELFSVFSTEMERVVNIKNVRKGIIDEDFKKQWPEETKLIMEMMSKKPSERPTADDILQKSFVSNRDEMVKKLEIQLSAKDKEVQELKKKLEEQNQLIEQFRRISCSNCGSQFYM